MEKHEYKVLVADKIALEGIEILKNKGYQVDIKNKVPEDELVEIIGSYDAIIVRSGTKVTRKVIEKAKNLKAVVRAGVGYNNIDVDACTEHGIVVMITPTGNTIAVVELTIGLMIAWSRNICLANMSMREGKWLKSKFQGIELNGKTLGIIGLGRIGQGVAKRAQAFNMKVLAFDRFIPKTHAEEIGVELYDDLYELLPKVDFLTLHVPLTDATRHLIGKKEFEMMKPNVVIVNTARGEVIDEKALYEALVNKRIAGACIDVFSKEPAKIDDFPFIALDNVISTPHLGASSKEAQINVAKLAADHIINALESNIFVDAVNLPFKLPGRLAEIYKGYMELAQYLGKFIKSAIKGRINKVLIEYKGEDFSVFEPIESIILYSMFKNRFSEDITFMNYKTQLHDHGVQIETHKLEKKTNLSNLIRISIDSEDKTISVIAGTVFSGTPKFMEIDGNYVDITPADYMLLLRSHDRPGVIGKVGTFLGKHNINIAGWQLGRDSKGSMALSVITLDDPIPDEIISKLKELDDVIDAHFINLS